MEGYRRAARNRPTVLAMGLLWGLGLMLLAGAVAWLFDGPVLGAIAALAAFPAGFGVGRTIGTSRYRWDGVSVSRLGLEAFVRGYAGSKGLEPLDRWRFHAHHRDLPLPGFATHVLAGPIEEARGRRGELALLSDAADHRVESDGATVAVWQPKQGNLLFTAEDLDGFRRRASEAVAALER